MSGKRGRPPKPKGTVTALVKKKTGLPMVPTTAVDPQALLSQAIAQGLPEVSMRELFAMRREMEAEKAKKDFFAALSKFQSICPIVEKTHKVPQKDGKKVVGTRYSYAAIEDLVVQAGPSLRDCGFSWTVKPEQTEKDVTAVVYAHHSSGHEEVTRFTVPIDPAAYMSDPQKVAAALTFATRYAFKGAFGIQTRGEDNDAQDDDAARMDTRRPIQPPQERGADVIPVAHEEMKKPVSDFEKIMKYLEATVYEPKTKKTIAVYTENEKIDYRHEATEAKDKPEELKKIGTDIVETWKKRELAIKGEAT